MTDLEQKYSSLIPSYTSALEKIKALLDSLIQLEKISIHALQGRVKTVESFSQKAIEYNNPFSEITDYIGIRIICYIPNDVQKICRLIEKEFTIDKDKSINKTSSLGIDKVGYESIHYIVKLNNDRKKLPEYHFMKDYCFEIQVRTILQHTWAEIEHDRNYKFSGSIPDSFKRRFNIISGTLELIDREFNNLASEIDLYKAQLKKDINKNNYNIEITTDSLIEYFAKKKEFYLLSSHSLEILNKKSEEIIQELYDYGIKNLSDFVELDKSVSKEIAFKKLDHKTILGYIRDCMIFNNAELYFKNSWKEHWTGSLDEWKKIYEENGIDLSKIMNKYSTKQKSVVL